MQSPGCAVLVRLVRERLEACTVGVFRQFLPEPGSVADVILRVVQGRRWPSAGRGLIELMVTQTPDIGSVFAFDLLSHKAGDQVCEGPARARSLWTYGGVKLEASQGDGDELRADEGVIHAPLLVSSPYQRLERGLCVDNDSQVKRGIVGHNLLCAETFFEHIYPVVRSVSDAHRALVELIGHAHWTRGETTRRDEPRL